VQPSDAGSYRAVVTNAYGSATSAGAMLIVAPSLVGAWGSNAYGQTNVPPWLTDVVAIAAGWYHNLALQSDGTVVGWGSNVYGQTNVPLWLTNGVAIAAGYYYSLALKGDGTLVGWGANDYGQTA
jgi:hypothetical protein